MQTKAIIDLLSADISVVAPYAVVKYLQYRFVAGEVKVFSSYVSFKPEHAKYGDK
ncbi:hypothetical protein ACFLYH_00680 [Candidatus Dependentiae bacterium]